MDLDVIVFVCGRCRGETHRSLDEKSALLILIERRGDGVDLVARLSRDRADRRCEGSNQLRAVL